MCDYSPLQTGYVYYVTTSDNQIRFPRLFSVDNVANCIKNHDDEASTSKCSKKYASVALKVSTYMFLWVCPKCAHCYGFHVIDWNEGRKRSCQFFNFVIENSTASNIPQLCMQFGEILFRSDI